ncbi:MAG: peroxide stress protein YaaA [Chryseobacterium sp.]|nr:MAG: peroxide stress protein YaaA [Chryseobacterium sp.]
MKIIVSPAKLMDIGRKSDLLPSTKPQFIREAAEINRHLREKDPAFIKELMQISDRLADENWQRNQDWKPNPTAAESTQALFAFTGEVYRGLDAPSLNKNAADYLQENLRILSGLYGMLKPSDRVMLYRLEMGRPFSFDGYKNLYAFWRDRVTDAFNRMLKKDEFVLHLASTEYAKVLDRKKLKAPLVDVDFYEMKSGKAKTIVVYTKHARGLLARFCAENQVQSREELKAFSEEGYLFDDEQSTENRLIYRR